MSVCVRKRKRQRIVKKSVRRVGERECVMKREKESEKERMCDR